MKPWKTVKLGAILHESKIVSSSPDVKKRLRVRLNMLGVEKRPETNEKEGATKYYTRRAGQFIYGKQNLHKGAFGIIPDNLDGFESSSDIPAFDIHEACFPEWIYYFFKKGDFYQKLSSIAKGVGSKRIQPSQIYDLEIFLPSIEEQKRILDLINKADEKHQLLLKETLLQEESFLKLRSAIFRDAVKGQLTLDWRTQNPQKASSRGLLEKIAELKITKSKSGNNRKPLNIQEVPNLAFEIPTEWQVASLNEITTLITDGKHGNCQDEYNSGYYFLSAKDIRDGTLNYEQAREINYKEFSEVHQRTNLKAGDLCIVNTGATVGKTAVVKDDPRTEKTTFQKSVAIIKVPKDLINVYFLELFLKQQTPQLLKISGGSAINNLLLSSIKSLKVPVPSFEEQTEIVRIVSKYLSYIDALLKECRQNRELGKQLIQKSLLDLLGTEGNIITDLNSRLTLKNEIQRTAIFSNTTTFMELADLLQSHGKLHAEDLWKMSKHYDSKNIAESIDRFYADLKIKIEVEKTIREVKNDKGYLELI